MGRRKTAGPWGCISVSEEEGMEMKDRLLSCDWHFPGRAQNHREG